MKRVYILTKWSSFPYETPIEWTVGVFSSVDTLRDFVEENYKVEKFTTKGHMALPKDPTDSFTQYGLEVSQHFIDTPEVDANKVQEEPKLSTGECTNLIFKAMLKKG